MSTLSNRIPRNLPSISVIIPTYNRAAMVTDAIDTVLAQTYRPSEIIVVDDGSTDETPETLSAYQRNITVIRQPNQGVSAARNRGIRAASGEFIALLDSDDYWLPSKLATQVSYFRDHPDIYICQTEETWIRNGARVNPKRRHQKYGGLIFEKSLPLCLISPSAVMIRKSLLDTVGLFDESLPACEDYDLWLRITWRYPVGLIETPLIVKRGGHNDQLSSMPELDKYRIQAIVKMLDQGCLSATQKAAALRILKQKCIIYAHGCRKRDKMAEAQAYLSLYRTKEQQYQ